MKNEILDEPIRDSFSDYLEKGETILWKGEPDIKRKNYGISIEGIVFYFLYSIVSSLIQSILHIGKNKKTDYAISTKRILFRLAHWNKNKIHDIPFSEIKNLLIVRDEINAIATIFLVIKNPAKINFDTFEILDNNKSEKRHQPTLENLQQVDKVAELIRQGIKNANGIIIKNERLNEPTSGSFSDSLKKDETILWEGSAIDPKYAITPSKRNPFDFIKTEAIIPILIGMFSGVYIILHDQLTTTGEIILVIATLLSLAILYLNRSKRVAEFALSNKRILIKSNYSKQRIIYDIPLSQLNNCIVVEKSTGRGTIFLALKNPEEIQFETFTIKDNNEIEKRHQPTLENIKNPQEVAKLIRQGIKQNN